MPGSRRCCGAWPGRRRLRPGRCGGLAKEGVGYLPAGSGVYLDLTVTENLEFRATGYRMSREAARERAAEYLDSAGLTSAASRLAGQLSGGMRCKLGVIAAMLPRPELLVLDEPTTGVDPVSRSGLWWLIARAAAEGCAVVLATTYLDEAERCGSVLVLDEGKVLATGTSDEIIAAMPGALRTAAARPDDSRAWRRGGQWRVWDPDGAAGDIQADLQDAVTVAAIAREVPSHEQPLAAADAGSPRGSVNSPRSRTWT